MDFDNTEPGLDILLQASGSIEVWRARELLTVLVRYHKTQLAAATRH